jgi:hypothetical protein
LATSILMVTSGLVFGQATSTFNGRVLDQGDAVLPGVTVTATNTNTGVVRTTVTNAEGEYFIPGLDPGPYNVKTELVGFQTAERGNVTLAINTTLTLGFKLTLAGVNETLTVTGEAPMIEATQSKLAATIQATELQNLPMITRTISGMLELLPGAASIEPMHRSKQNVGSVSYGGSAGTNVIPTVDGADNRDNQYGGPLMSYTVEGLEQFQLSTSLFTAGDGRGAGAALQMVTKSGTNQLHGSAFGYERDRKLSAKDYFTAKAGTEKVPFSRQQYGGSLGGPIVKNRMFFFGAIERVDEDTSLPVPNSSPTDVYGQLNILANAMNAGQIPSGLVNPNHPLFAPTPGRLLMYTVKANAQLSNTQSMMVRYAGQKDDRDAVTVATNNDQREPENSRIRMYSLVGQHSLVLGNKGLNQITGQVNHLSRVSDVTSNITGEHYTRDFPSVHYFLPRLSFPTVNTGAGGSGGSLTDTYVLQIRDDVSLLMGTHALKFGGNYNALPNLGNYNNNEHFVTLTFFDDPSVIASNSNGRYPQGFQTPGIVRQWQQANGGAVNGVGSAGESRKDAAQAMAWFQDDWRVNPKLTLNLGVRYDVDIHLLDQQHWANNATMLLLRDIGDPNGALPKTPRKNISPRLGLAYDLSGDGQRVIRGGYGLYFDQYNTSAASGDLESQNRRPLNILATLVNTAVGVGQLATYRLGIDPLPPQPTEGNRLGPNSTGQWYGNRYADPYSHVAHVGYAHTLAANTVVSADFTYSVGRDGLRSLNINPLVSGQRLLVPALVAHGYAANQFSNVNILSAINKSRYDATTVMFQRRFPRATFQAHYTFAHAYAYGGSTGARGGAAAPMIYNQPFGPGEWGPTGQDERHRLVATGVFDLAYGVQVSPVFQTASARPYNLTAGSDLNADGNNNDRYIDPATGQQVSINAGRGDATYVFDMRATKFLSLGSSDRKVGLFAEFFNLFNTANFGGSFTGNARSATFRQATGFVPGIGYPRQAQLGVRLLF